MDSFLPMMLFSKLSSEPMSLTMACMILIFMIKHMPYSLSLKIESYLVQFCKSRDESFIVIPYHNKSYTYGFQKSVKTLYSERFLAINHYIKENNIEVPSMVEIMNFENGNHYDDCSEFVLLPTHYGRTLICKDIYFEIVIEQDVENNKEEKDQVIRSKKYIFKLSTKGKGKLHVLKEFIEECLINFRLTKNDSIQMIYEFERSRKDEDDNLSMLFTEFPFSSTKTFSNIFFPEKEKVIEDIREFSAVGLVKKEIEAKYKRIGIPYKRTYLLHGPPGCGKTSLIKAIINETGRHCVLVQWSRIKTSTEFENLCRDIKVHSKTVKQKDIILVFEDFDANRSSAVKIRENLKKDTSTSTSTSTSAEIIESIKLIEKEDELTLECVLNTLDGVKELHDAIIIFTTNVLESIDPALIRPGRIDRLIHMGPIYGDIVREMIQHFYDIPIPEPIGTIEPITPAKIQEICIQNPDVSTCIRSIQNNISV